MLVMTACGNFAFTWIFWSIFWSIFTKYSTKVIAQIWTTKCDLKKGISLDDSNFDMENYSSLVDVKLLLKRILDGY